MQKKILAVLALSLISSNAFASRAKNLVTGTGDGGFILSTNGNSGSFYSDDEYNMFWNPAFINGMKSMAIVEKFNGNNDASAGFTTNFGSINAAVFFNRDAASHGSKPIDLVIGGDMGVKWGLGVTQTTSEVESSTNLKAGVVMGSFEPFVGYLLSSSNGGTGVAEQTASAMSAGLRYHMGDWAPYAVWGTNSVEQNSTKTIDQSKWGVGLGRTAKMGDVKMNYSVAYFSTTDDAAGANDTSSLPINLNMEADATSWLTVRAGLGYTLMESGVDAGDLATTTARFGGTFHLGKADLDMVVGGGSAAGNVDSVAFDAANGFFSAASLTYRM
jgi:hypothetical protein